MTEPVVGEVECYSGHAYAVEPRAFVWQGARHEIVDLVARWRTPTGPAFRVRTAGGALFDLAYDDAGDTWTIAPSSTVDPKPSP